MDKLEKLTEPMSLTETAVRAAYQVVVTNNEYSPVGMGSGCILYYKERLFFLTVAHVTDKADTKVVVETNYDPVDNKTPTYRLPGMNYFDILTVDDKEKFKESFSADSIKEIKTLDFAFTELFEPIDVKQKEMDFERHGIVPLSTKIVIPGDNLNSNPESDEPALFYGTINGDFQNGVLGRQPKLTLDCEYLGDLNEFYKFRLPSVIKEASEFQGTSGAPVIDTKGTFLGLISYGFEGLPFIFAFKNTEIKKYLDFYIDKHPKQES